MIDSSTRRLVAACVKNVVTLAPSGTCLLGEQEDNAVEAPYEEPKVERLGSLFDMTQTLNKVGNDSDVFSGLTGLSGSIVSVP